MTLFSSNLFYCLCTTFQHLSVRMLSLCLHMQTITYCAVISCHWLTMLTTTMDLSSSLFCCQLKCVVTLTPPNSDYRGKCNMPLFLDRPKERGDDRSCWLKHRAWHLFPLLLCITNNMPALRVPLAFQHHDGVVQKLNQRQWFLLLLLLESLELLDPAFNLTGRFRSLLTFPPYH